MRLIVTITGASGVGKSTLERALMLHFGGGRVRTITTRSPRPQETDRDYDFQSYASLRNRAGLVWKVEIHNHIYAVARSAFDEAWAQTAGIAFVSITPERHEFVATYFKADDLKTLAIHLVKPMDKVLRKRLWARPGATEADVEKRITDSHEFERVAAAAAKSFELNYIAPDTKEEVLKQVLKLIEQCLAPN